MLKPCKIKDLHTPTFNTPGHVPSPKTATSTPSAPQITNITHSYTNRTANPSTYKNHSDFTFPFTYTHSTPPYYSHFQQPFLPPHNSLPTPSILTPYSVPTPFPHLPPHTTIPSTTSTTHCQQTHNLLVKSMRVHQSV